MEKRLYVVGIGAQRAGTTWLARMFDSHPDIGMSPVKETHYWTSKHVDHQRNAVRGLQALKIRMPLLLGHCLRHPGEAPRWLAAYAGMCAHRDDSYRRFIDLGRYGCTVAGEITPAYATLSASAFAALEACLPEPRYVFILRNPADRFISQIAHTADRDPSVLTASASDLLSRPYFAMRSGYRDSWTTCRSVAGPDRLHTLFYEDLFDPRTAQATFDALCAFLDVRSVPVDISKVVNARPLPAHAAARADIVKALQDDYRFGQSLRSDGAPRSWQEDLNALERSITDKDQSD